MRRPALTPAELRAIRARLAEKRQLKGDALAREYVRDVGTLLADLTEQRRANRELWDLLRQMTVEVPGGEPER